MQRVHDHVVPAGLPGAVGGGAAAALAQDCDRLVHAAEHRLVALEDLHQHARVMGVPLQHLLGEDEVGVQ